MAKTTGNLGVRLNQRVSKMTDKLDDRKTPLGLLVLAIGAFLAFVAFISTTGPPFQSKYQVVVSVPADAPVLREGQAVRIGGKLAGLISAVEADRDEGDVNVTANITKTAFRPLPADTEANVRVHSIVYETYLELLPGESDEELADGDPLESPATSGVDLLEVVQLFDEQARADLRGTVVNVGFGVAGRGVQLNQALADVLPLSRNLSSQLEAVTRDKGALADAVAGAAATARGARGARPDDVGSLIASSDAVLGTVAGRLAELRRTIRLLRPFEDQFLETAPLAEAVLNDIAALSADLEPAARSLNASLPSLNRLFSLGDVLRTEIERITDVADPVLAAARPVVFGLFPTMTALGPLNANLKTLKATVEPYKPEIARAGRRLADATDDRFPQGVGSGAGAVAGRVVPVLTPHPCTNPFPEPGEAQGDSCP
ncbi:MAG: MlaD family protein [Actinomycetota bacterium]|nr:MlaD family protein [Actinomycetota bacterium]